MVKQITIIGGVGLAALAMILLIPTEKCTEFEFLVIKIKHCETLSIVQTENLKYLSVIDNTDQKSNLNLNEDFLIGTWSASPVNDIPVAEFIFQDGRNVVIKEIKGESIAKAMYDVSLADNTITFTDSKRNTESGSIYLENEDEFMIDFGMKKMYFLRMSS